MIDNGSTDGTIQFLKTLPKAKVIINKLNRGFSGGCNQGLQDRTRRISRFIKERTVVTNDLAS